METASAGPLAGIIVVDFSRYLPGPFCTLQLAWLGARVVTIEQPPGGDPMRFLPPLGEDGTSLASASLTRGKQQQLLDLGDADQLEGALALCDEADVVVESFRPGVADRLGIGADALRVRNGRLVYCSLSGYGQTGPWSQVAGHDANYAATAGLLEQVGPAEAPVLPPVPLADLAGGSLAATAICAALLRRERGGSGSQIDISLAEAALAWQPHSLPAAATGELARGAGMLTGRLACYSLYACADGRHVAVAAMEPKFFARLLELLGLPADLVLGQYDQLRQASLREQLAASFQAQPAGYWHELLATSETCVTQLARPHEVAAHPQLRARGAIELVGSGNDVPVPASPFLFDGIRTRASYTATGSGQR